MNTRLQDTLEMITGHSVQIPTDNDLTPVDGQDGSTKFLQQVNSSNEGFY